jgi:hypothetical protein
MTALLVAMANDDIVSGFRKRAGLGHPGTRLRGWHNNNDNSYSRDFDEVLTTFGQ